MARPIVLSNGELHVGINTFGLVHDFYYPYVGLENHAAGQNLRHKVGVWIDGQLSWLDDGSWQISFQSAKEALIGHTRAQHDELGIVLEFDDFVDANSTTFLRNIHVVNVREYARQVRLFLHQAFVIGDSGSNTDTAQYLPDSDAVLHYRGRRAFVIGAQDQSGAAFDQHSIGLFGIEGREGTWRDAEDGELSNGNVEHGRVDSTLRVVMQLEGHASTRVHYWIAAGRTTREALELHKNIQDNGLDELQTSTVTWWHNWLAPARASAEHVPKEHRENFIKSAMIIKSHIDKRGALIASTDTAMLHSSRDAYGYCWPRDAANSLWPLIRMGYENEAQAFFRFCVDVIHPSGYLMHKYRADGALGSSWHPYVHDEVQAPPIQEDETASVLFVFTQYYHAHPSPELLDEFYETLIQPMADYMATNVQSTTGLPRASYDLWEEVFLTTTYTVSVVYAALEAASQLADIRGNKTDAVRWRATADDIKVAAGKHLYNQEKGYFRKGLLSVNGQVSYEDRLDMSSFFGVFMYGLFAPDSPEVISTLEHIKSDLGNSDTPGLPRYNNDGYFRISAAAPSNWWFISSLWVAQYYLEREQPEDAMHILDWVQSHMSSTGQLSEQLNPATSEQLSVTPLVWSHAEYVSALLDTSSKASL